MGAPLKIIGVINPYVALMAEKLGAQALYVSGAGVANYSWGLPDLGVTNLNDVSSEVRKILSVSNLPLYVDIDTGFGPPLMIARAIRTLEKDGATAIHIEDQKLETKRCGHRAGKQVVSIEEMLERLDTCLQTRDKLLIGARTDAYETEGIEGVIKRAEAYAKAGADFIFADALRTFDEIVQLKKSISKPLLVNQTEFGVTPLIAYDDFKKAGIDMILFPLSCARGMNAQAEKILKQLIQNGEAGSLVDQMQPRSKLYEYLRYEEYESGR